MVPGRRWKGRPRNSWMQKVTTGMRQRGINNLEWADREGWRRKMKLKFQAQKYVKTSRLYIKNKNK